MARYFRLRPKKRAFIARRLAKLQRPTRGQRPRIILRRDKNETSSYGRDQKKGLLRTSGALKSITRVQPRESPFPAFLQEPEPAHGVTYERIRDILTEQPGPRKTICQQRATRQEVLFAKRIAGVGKRNSPGKGGTYKRTPTSNIQCERSL